MPAIEVESLLDAVSKVRRRAPVEFRANPRGVRMVAPDVDRLALLGKIAAGGLRQTRGLRERLCDRGKRERLRASYVVGS